MRPTSRLDGIEISLIRQINALATPLSVNLGIGEPNVVPDEVLREMAAGAATETSWAYSPNAGSVALRNRLAATVAAGADAATGICVTAGTEEGLYAIFQAYVGPGDEVLVPDPGFVAYATIARLCGGVPVPYRLEPPLWRLEAQAIEAAISPRTRLIIINSPSNPLGAVASRETLSAIADLAAERDCLVISDEVYSEIWYDRPPASMLGMGPSVVVVSGMSKSHAMTGLRLGWIVASAGHLAPVVKAHQYIATCASVFSQSLAERILAAEEWNRGWLDRVREQFRRQRDAALHAIARELDVGIEPPAGAFYAFAPVPSCDTVSFAKTLATDAAVLVIPGIAFGASGEGFIRISFAAPIEQIVSGIERIGRFLRSAGR